jgi:hypothetical protein
VYTSRVDKLSAAAPAAAAVAAAPAAAYAPAAANICDACCQYYYIHQCRALLRAHKHSERHITANIQKSTL